MNKICFGCGIKLQSTDKEKLGYVPEKKFESSKYCMRCFRMMHYGEVKLEETPKDKKEIINKINKDNKFVIFLVDFLNINENTMDLYKSIKRDKILVINKCELLPKHVKRENIKKFITEYYHVNGEIRIKGGNNSHGATSILNYLEKNNIKYQVSTLGKIDLGGGGTIAYILANKGIEVVDAGIGVLSMHAPYEVTSKFDIYSAYKFYYKFFMD